MYLHVLCLEQARTLRLYFVKELVEMWLERAILLLSSHESVL